MLLSNRLAHLAEAAGSEARAFRRSSIEAHASYLRAGAILAEARSEARRGEWSAVLERAGISERVARNMMVLARSGMTAETVHAAGGVASALAGLRNPETGKPEFNSGIAPALESPAPGASPAPATSADKARERRQRRRAAGLCVECGKPSDGAARCPACAARISQRRKDRRTRTRFGERMAEIAGQPLAAAASAGRGVRIRLSATEAAELAAMIAANREAEQ